jgi:hypothetical protein
VQTLEFVTSMIVAYIGTHYNHSSEVFDIVWLVIVVNFVQITCIVN